MYYLPAFTVTNKKKKKKHARIQRKQISNHCLGKKKRIIGREKKRTVQLRHTC